MPAHKASLISVKNSQFGSSMIEVLVTVLIVSVGLLGIAALFVRSQKMGDEAYQRFQALHIAHQLAETLSTNRAVAGWSVLPTPIPGGYLTGADGLTAPAGYTGFTATCPDDATCQAGIFEFDQALSGADKKTGGANNAALVSALGCVEPIVSGVAGSPVDPLRYGYRVSVAWQGQQDSATPQASDSLCGKDQFGNEQRRRIVSLEVQVF